MYAKIILKPGKEESLKRFHPWVFSGAVARIEPRAIEEGDKALVVSSQGEVLGVGHTQIGSIAVRMLSFKDEVIDLAFYEERLRRALRLRQDLNLLRGEEMANLSRGEEAGLRRGEEMANLSRGGEVGLRRGGRVAGETANNTFRLVHGEGDFLPALVIDVYGDTAVMQTHSVGMCLDREIIAEALARVCKKFIRHIYDKSEGTLPYKAGLADLRDGYLYPESLPAASRETSPDTTLETSRETSPEAPLAASCAASPMVRPIAIENGIKFYPDWEGGQKTGFFVDQRENRALVEHYAAGRRVLNMFCYTGGFSLYALRGGAEQVHSVDASAKAMELVERNVELNFGEEPRHKSFTADAFEFLNKIDGPDDSGTGAAYDLIILDPPAFAKHQKVLNRALLGYRRLNAQAFRKIAPGGILFTFSCSQAVSAEDFRKAVFTAAAQSGRRVRILHRLTQPADHPVNIYHPEGEYLKGLVLYVE